jgi:hypothetical protein
MEGSAKNIESDSHFSSSVALPHSMADSVDF